MTLGAVGPLGGLSAPLRPAGRRDGPADTGGTPGAGQAAPADTVEIGAGAPLGAGPLHASLAAAAERLEAAASRDESRGALVAIENIRSASMTSAGALAEAAARLGGEAPRDDGPLAAQNAGIFSPEPGRVLQLLGD